MSIQLSRFHFDFHDDKNNVHFRRRQFPIKLSYALTINKAQGQTCDVVGLYLSTDVFSPGQLYTAMSRVRQREALHIYAPNSSHNDKILIKNVVAPGLHYDS